MKSQFAGQSRFCHPQILVSFIEQLAKSWNNIFHFPDHFAAGTKFFRNNCDREKSRM